MRKFLIIFLVVLLLGTTLTVGYLRPQFLRLVNLSVETDLTRSNSSGPLRVETSAGDFLEITGFEPAASATLALKSSGMLKFKYQLRSAGQVMVFAKPLHQGNRLPSCFNTGSPMYLLGAGEGSFSLGFPTPTACDGLEVYMEVGDLPMLLYARRVVNADLHLLTMRIPVAWEWK